MKLRIIHAGLAALLWLFVNNTNGQGVLVVDQASGTLEEPVVNSLPIPLSDIAQSFTPSLNAVGFVQLRSLLAQPSGSRVTLTVNLRQGAYNGPVISSTAPIIVDGFADVGTVYFSENIPVNPGEMYFFEPVLRSPGSLDIGFKSPSSYLAGDLWGNGVKDSTADLWFREGIVIPEPKVGWLFLFGGSIFLWRKRATSRQV